jgi:hypothetical protein
LTTNFIGVCSHQSKALMVYLTSFLLCSFLGSRWL